MNILENYEKGNIPKLTHEDVLAILRLASELKSENEELKEKLVEYEERIEETNRDPRKCGCGYTSDNVLKYGRCSSCM